ncbi:G2/M phase-specific E3 ubiquitin-protein ligase [Bulinus truncatus]|nr:G2/M phase-specific E3 ubiquitin-protein ligase [Bulinus truncatus]
MSRHYKGIFQKRKVMKRSASIYCDTANADTKVCDFCQSEEDSELKFGAFYQKEGVTVHYFCLLLSSGLFQKTRVSDKRSILGFMVTDIRNEIKRGKKLTCCFCNMKGATIGCCDMKCKKKFHLSCSLENGVLHQYFDNYRSYCADHRMTQTLVKTLSKDKTKLECAICFSRIRFTSTSPNSLVCPCCKHCYFHRTCIQSYAISAGKHFLKCPLCNEAEKFQDEMLEFGIYIPDQDASWERETNAYQELLERHSSCDAPDCSCPFGREYDADSGNYELLLCGLCGSSGSHRKCQSLVLKDDLLVCRNCHEILESVVHSKIEKCDNKMNEDLNRTHSCNSSSPKHQVYLDYHQTTSSCRKRRHSEYFQAENSCYSQVRLRSGQHSCL